MAVEYRIQKYMEVLSLKNKWKLENVDAPPLSRLHFPPFRPLECIPHAI